MHPLNKWEGLSNKLFWIVASEHNAIAKCYRSYKAV